MIPSSSSCLETEVMAGALAVMLDMKMVEQLSRTPITALKLFYIRETQISILFSPLVLRFSVTCS